MQKRLPHVVYGGFMMDIDRMVRSQSVPLPEHILRRREAGDLDGAVRAIDVFLARDHLPPMLRDRLLCEKERIRRLPTQYPWNREQAMEKLRGEIGDITEADFDRLEDEGVVDFIYLNGEKRYFVRFHRSIGKQGRIDPADAWLDPMVEEIMAKGEMEKHITLDVKLSLVPERFTPGEYLAHLPYPLEECQQSEVSLVAGTPNGITDGKTGARTAWWRKQMDAWEDFHLRYRYVSRIRYADPLHAPAPAAPLYPNTPEPTADDLAEEPPFIRFTPYLKSLAQELTQGETTPAGKAWRIYEFVTTRINYSFVRDYFQLDHIGEFCAVNLRGDCGLQALLFIQLCRICGIPARWQSGMSIDPGYAGSHDWAQFYLEGWGWLFADPSYGGSAWRAGNAVRHAFYFGNIDPLRMAANCRFEPPLEPAKQAFRVDPYDNQSGELERFGAEMPFTGRDLDCDAVMVEE